MNQETLKELFVEQIRDVYDAERQLVKALPKLSEATESPELAEGLLSHLEETKDHVSRLEEIFQLIQVAPHGKPCKAMRGLIEEGSEAAQDREGVMRDLAIIAAAQRVEHYEISAYGTSRTMAEHLGLERATALLQQTQDEERSADTKLTELAAALYESSSDEVEEEEEQEREAAAGMGVSHPGRKASPKHGSERKVPR